MKRPCAISAAAILIGILPLLAAGCTAVPKGLRPVPGFEVDRYLGKWYEIARLDHSFERGLSRVTAEYSKNDDGSIRVVNQGFDEKEKRVETHRGPCAFHR